MSFASELKTLRERYGVRCDKCEFGDFEGSSRRCSLKMDFTSESDWCESWVKVTLVEPEKPQCKGFHWLGQSMDHCDMCGKDISLHEGLAWRNTADPFAKIVGETIVPFDEARKRIPMFAHYVTPIGHPEGPYRYEHPAEYWNADAP